MRPIVRYQNLIEFFREAVQWALTEVRVDLAEVTEFYLVNLLHEFRRTERFFQRGEDEEFDETPLALILERAIAGAPTDRIRALKQIGDSSLYVAGFFPARAARRLVNLDYYIGMGGVAYCTLSHMLANQKAFAEIYEELGKKFADCVEVLAVAKRAGASATNADLLKLYERWLETGSDRLGALLEKEGIPLTPAAKTRQ
ncbi:MAG: hypothetical protein HY543_05995 [Deltaproteobacteria bacterium]|nr:hypothetical protein [Deltaproteobacteria bacterium]